MKVIVNRSVRYGGISTFLLDLLDVLNPNESILLFLNPNINSNILREIKSKMNLKIVFLPRVSSKVPLILNRLYQSLFIEYYLFKYKIDSSQIIYSDWNLILDILGMINRRKKIVFIHTYPTRELPTLIKKITDLLLKSTEVITVSEYSAKKIREKWSIPNHKISVIYNKSRLLGSSKVKHLNANRIRIVTIAHCEEYKNPRLWFKIAKQITKSNPAISFHWYGDGNLFDYYADISKDIKNIYFHGYVSNPEEIFENDCDIYIQTSLKESLGISILDAMNYSIPCLVNNVGGMPELIKNDFNGYVCSNIDEFVNSINRLIIDNKKYSSFSMHTKTLYDEKFSAQNWENTVLNLLE